MDRARILEKIQKCLNLSKSPEPHEAAAALRQAQKLMDRHSVSAAELSQIGFAKETVFTSIQVNRKTTPVRVNNLALLIKHAFGVEAVIYGYIARTDANYCIDYYGPQDRVIMAVYSHTVVMRALDAAFETWKRQNAFAKGVRGARASFDRGWLAAVTEKVAALGVTEEEKAGIDAMFETDGLSDIKEAKGSNEKVYGNVFQAGIEAAEDFSLHRPVGRENLKLEKS